MSRQLYFECASGISGDMTVAALLDLGASRKLLRDTLETLPIEEPYSIKISRVKKSGLDVCDFLVELPEDEQFYDHDMTYLHGHEEHPGHHAHEHHSHEHQHHGRGPEEIGRIFSASGMTKGAKKIAERILDILAEAEACVHGKPKSEVHFHEAGAVDSIIDIASAAICLDDLITRFHIDGVIVREMAEGKGSVRCQHGLLPIPVPAVTKIVSAHNLKLHFLPVEGELVTPTGAAIAAAVATSDTLPSSARMEKCGMGAGKRSYQVPEILRVFLLETEDTKDRIYKLETNIDDCSGEVLGYVMELLFAAGAKDVSYMPVFMKKNRPAYELHVICRSQEIEQIEEIIFRETTTIGIRRIAMERTVLFREERAVETPLGKARVKVCRDRDLEKVYPEYDSMAALAGQHGLPLSEVYDIVKNSAKKGEHMDL